MSDCEKYQELISCLLDGELTAEESDGLRRHMEDCEKCRAMYEAFTSLQNALEADMEEPPEKLASAVMSEIRKNTPKKPVRLWRYVAAAACIAVVAVTAVRSGLFSGAKSAATETAVMMAADVRDDMADDDEQTVETTEAAGEPAEAPVPEPEEYAVSYFDAAGISNDACEPECAEEENFADNGLDLNTKSAVRFALLYDGICYVYDGHTAVLDDGAALADASLLTETGGESYLRDSKEIGKFFRTEDTLFVPDGNGEWDVFVLEK